MADELDTENNFDDVEAAALFLRGSAAGVDKVLQKVNEESRKRSERFNEMNFTLGVLNAFLIVYIFAAFPQHFWILYVIEAFILIPIKYKQMCNLKPLSGKYYVYDYCWCMNFVGVFALLLLSVTRLSDTFHEELFLASMGTANGPLLGAAFLLPMNSLVFHDFGTMCDLFIHIFPPMLLYTLHWKSAEILQAWPNVFELDYNIHFFPSVETHHFLGQFGIGSVFGNTICLYLLWFIPYTFWMYKNLDLPRRGESEAYDTVFHSTMRKGLGAIIGKYIFSRPDHVIKDQVETNYFLVKDLVVYMSAHAIASLLSIVTLAYLCYKNEFLNGLLLVILTVVCTLRGAARYTYYSTKMYVKMIRNVLDESLLEIANAKKKKTKVANERTPLINAS